MVTISYFLLSHTLVFLIYFLVFVYVGVCMCRSYPHTLYLRLIFTENFCPGTQWCIWIPDSPHAQPRMCIFYHEIFLLGFMQLWCFGQGQVCISFDGEIQRNGVSFSDFHSSTGQWSCHYIKSSRWIQTALKGLHLVYLDCSLLSSSQQRFQILSVKDMLRLWWFS